MTANKINSQQSVLNHLIICSRWAQTFCLHHGRKASYSRSFSLRLPT